jgi:hypothetical protein
MILRRCSVLVGMLAIAGCATERGYEGPVRPARELAVIEGAPRVNAGLPLVPVIRKIDDRVLEWKYSSVEVLPGEHRLLVDCSRERSTTRYDLYLIARAGHRYVLVAESSPGNHSCESVRIEER